MSSLNTSKININLTITKDQSVFQKEFAYDSTLSNEELAKQLCVEVEAELNDSTSEAKRELFFTTENLETQMFALFVDRDIYEGLVKKVDYVQSNVFECKLSHAVESREHEGYYLIYADRLKAGAIAIRRRIADLAFINSLITSTEHLEAIDKNHTFLQYVDQD